MKSMASSNSASKSDHEYLPKVRVVAFSNAAPHHVETGLLGWLACEFGDLLRVSSITLRRTHEGVLYLSFPERVDSAGRRHADVHPLTKESRRAIERAVIRALEVQGHFWKDRGK
jgi:DNA-binding cell septation regulator SpoVG